MLVLNRCPWVPQKLVPRGVTLGPARKTGVERHVQLPHVDVEIDRLRVLPLETLRPMSLAIAELSKQATVRIVEVGLGNVGTGRVATSTAPFSRLRRVVILDPGIAMFEQFAATTIEI